MKKIISILISLFAFCVLANFAWADWSVTVTWTRSTGPNLDYEECRLDGEVKKTVQETEVTSCQFNVANLNNQKVSIVSFNSQGGNTEYVVGQLYPAPVPASGGTITTIWVNP